ncbi:MAG: bifunctional DNA primase/polymerase [Myxococcota bacterium]
MSDAPAGVYVPLHPKKLVPLAAFDEAVSTAGELEQRWPGCAVGVRADRAGLLVVDVDVKNDAPGPETMRRLQAMLGALPRTRVHRSRSGGWHLLFRAVPGVRSAQGTLRGRKEPATGVDIVAGRAVIRWAPGTPGYRLASNRPIAELPEAWAHALRDPPAEPREASIPSGDSPARRYALAALEKEYVELAGTTAMRNCALTRAAGCLGQLVPQLTSQEITEALLLACQQNDSYREHGERVCRKTIERGLKWGMANPRSRTPR